MQACLHADYRIKQSREPHREKGKIARQVNRSGRTGERQRIQLFVSETGSVWGVIPRQADLPKIVPIRVRPYTRAFDAIYPELAAKHGLLLYPFFLDGVAMNAKLNLDDGLHPNSRGVAEITKKILPSVEQLIERARAKQAAGTKG